MKTNNKLLRLFRTRSTPIPEQPIGSLAQPGPKIGQQLNEFEQFLDDYLKDWRIGTQQKEL